MPAQGPLPPGVSRTPSNTLNGGAPPSPKYPIAIDWRLSARDRGLGLAYEFIPIDHDQCMEMLIENENVADPVYLAMLDCNIGWCLLNGKGCAKDYAKALAWFKRRRPSCAGSQYNIGICFSHGLGTDSYERQAAEAMGKYHEYRVLERTRFEIANSGAAALDKA